ncbi:MAG: DUF4936 family protein [Burkholderiales bacterium]
MSFSYYIYYRVSDPRLANPVLTRLFELMGTRAGVRGRLLVRRDEPDLWMEIYEDVEQPAQFEQTLAQCVDELQFTGLLPPEGTRNLECFREPCA